MLGVIGFISALTVIISVNGVILGTVCVPGVIIGVHLGVQQCRRCCSFHCYHLSEGHH